MREYLAKEGLLWLSGLSGGLPPARPRDPPDFCLPPGVPGPK